jgi:hypothetical protein
MVNGTALRYQLDANRFVPNHAIGALLESWHETTVRLARGAQLLSSICVAPACRKLRGAAGALVTWLSCHAALGVAPVTAVLWSLCYQQNSSDV